MPHPLKQIICESLLLVDALAARQRELLRRIRYNERQARKQVVNATAHVDVGQKEAR